VLQLQNQREREREKYLRMNIQHIRDEFPSQLNTTWQAFSAGIKVVQENTYKAISISPTS
jgi:hypothetical protein